MKKIKILKIILVFFLTWFVSHIFYITYDGLNDQIEKSDVAIVLGKKIDDSGEPSAQLKSRLDKGIELYQKGTVRKILVTGGKEPNGFIEAEVMKKYLLEKNIPQEHILTEDKSTSTRENAAYSAPIIKQNNFQSVIIVSQFYHLTRAKMLFKKQGLKNFQSVPADLVFDWEYLYMLPREFFAYYYYLFRPPSGWTSLAPFL